jgi:hypothetical protein
MSMVSNTQGEDKKFVLNFGQKISGEETTWEPQLKLEYNYRIGSRKSGVKV